MISAFGVDHAPLAKLHRPPPPAAAAEPKGVLRKVDSGFNHAAAQVAYDTVMALDDDAAGVYAAMLAGEALAHDLTVYDDVLCQAVAEHLDRHGAAMKERLVGSYIAKRLDGGDVAAVLAAAQELAKAFEGFDYSPQERARRAREQQRDLASGRFVRAHVKIDTSGAKKPHGARHAERLGIPEPNARVKLTPAQQARYQDAYRQIAEALAPYTRREARDPGSVSAHFVSRSGALGEPLAPDEALEELVDNPRFVPPAVAVSVLPAAGDLNVAPYDTLRDVGANLGTVYGDPEQGTARIRQFEEFAAGGDPHSLGSRLFARLYASTKLADDTLGDSAPKKVQLALKTGQMVGAYGPEAQRVFGPAADRAAYRYRGTERDPDRRLTNAVETLRRNPGIKPADKREVLIHGVETDTGWRPSGVLSYFRTRLPSADLNTLQRKSGTIPPSEGIILDKTGKVVTQAVGYGDDHYLPFNLKNLKGLRGGEYIRTRTWGGPTTEDVYTGLIAGANAITVASHNGVYTVEFDPSFKGGRRYNDKAARMVARYGQLLDAVRAGEITTGQLDPSRTAELEARAESTFDRDSEPAEFRAELDRLKAAEMRNPTFSEAQRAAAGAAFLDNEALKHRTPGGHEMTRTELVDSWLNTQAAKRYHAYRQLELDPGESARQGVHTRVEPGKTAGDFKREIAQQYGLDDPDPIRFSANAVEAMGLGERYQRFVEREEQTYRESLKPLQLNGPGYQLALNALREQFPYYISRVEYHPWVDARNGRDTGYVKPRHNRPAEALSGYFDASIGAPKVHADTTRYQNRHTQPVPYTSRTQRIAAQAQKAAATVTGGATGRALDPKAARELRIEADRAMLEHLKKQTHFSGAAHSGGDPSFKGATLKRQPVEDFAADLARQTPELSRLLTADRHQLDRELADNPDEFHRRLKAAVDQAEKYGLFDLDLGIKRGFRDEGKPTPAKKLERGDVGETLRTIEAGTDIDFGRAYETGRDADPDKVTETYAADLHVKNAVATLRLPASVADAGFTAAAEKAGEGLRARNRAYLDWQARGANPATRPKDHDRLSRDAEGLARAVQLRRRWEEARDRQQAAKEAAAPAGALSAVPQFSVEVKMPPGFAPPEVNSQALPQAPNDISGFNWR